MHRFHLNLGFFLLLLLFFQAINGTTIHIDNVDGKDTNDGSPEHPLASMLRAAHLCKSMICTWSLKLTGEVYVLSDARISHSLELIYDNFTLPRPEVLFESVSISAQLNTSNIKLDMQSACVHALQGINSSISWSTSGCMTCYDVSLFSSQIIMHEINILFSNYTLMNSSWTLEHSTLVVKQMISTLHTQHSSILFRDSSVSFDDDVCNSSVPGCMVHFGSRSNMLSSVTLEHVRFHRTFSPVFVHFAACNISISNVYTFASIHLLVSEENNGMKLSSIIFDSFRLNSEHTTYLKLEYYGFFALETSWMIDNVYNVDSIDICSASRSPRLELTNVTSLYTISITAMDIEYMASDMRSSTFQTLELDSVGNTDMTNIHILQGQLLVFSPFVYIEDSSFYSVYSSSFKSFTALSTKVNGELDITGLLALFSSSIVYSCDLKVNTLEFTNITFITSKYRCGRHKWYINTSRLKGDRLIFKKDPQCHVNGEATFILTIVKDWKATFTRIKNVSIIESPVLFRFKNSPDYTISLYDFTFIGVQTNSTVIAASSQIWIVNFRVEECIFLNDFFHPLVGSKLVFMSVKNSLFINSTIRGFPIDYLRDTKFININLLSSFLTINEPTVFKNLVFNGIERNVHGLSYPVFELTKIDADHFPTLQFLNVNITNMRRFDFFIHSGCEATSLVVIKSMICVNSIFKKGLIQGSHFTISFSDFVDITSVYGLFIHDREGDIVEYPSSNINNCTFSIIDVHLGSLIFCFNNCSSTVIYSSFFSVTGGIAGIISSVDNLEFSLHESELRYFSGRTAPLAYAQNIEVFMHDVVMQPIPYVNSTFPNALFLGDDVFIEMGGCIKLYSVRSPHEGQMRFSRGYSNNTVVFFSDLDVMTFVRNQSMVWNPSLFHIRLQGSVVNLWYQQFAGIPDFLRVDIVFTRNYNILTSDTTIPVECLNVKEHVTTTEITPHPFRLPESPDTLFFRLAFDVKNYQKSTEYVWLIDGFPVIPIHTSASTINVTAPRILLPGEESTIKVFGRNLSIEMKVILPLCDSGYHIDFVRTEPHCTPCPVGSLSFQFGKSHMCQSQYDALDDRYSQLALITGSKYQISPGNFVYEYEWNGELSTVLLKCRDDSSCTGGFSVASGYSGLRHDEKMIRTMKQRNTGCVEGKYGFLCEQCEQNGFVVKTPFTGTCITCPSLYMSLMYLFLFLMTIFLSIFIMWWAFEKLSSSADLKNASRKLGAFWITMRCIAHLLPITITCFHISTSSYLSILNSLVLPGSILECLAFHFNISEHYSPQFNLMLTSGLQVVLTLIPLLTLLTYRCLNRSHVTRRDCPNMLEDFFYSLSDFFINITSTFILSFAILVWFQFKVEILNISNVGLHMGIITFKSRSFLNVSNDYVDLLDFQILYSFFALAWLVFCYIWIAKSSKHHKKTFYNGVLKNFFKSFDFGVLILRVVVVTFILSTDYFIIPVILYFCALSSVRLFKPFVLESDTVRYSNFFLISVFVTCLFLAFELPFSVTVFALSLLTFMILLERRVSELSTRGFGFNKRFYGKKTSIPSETLGSVFNLENLDSELLKKSM
ncbi:hypothetical protein PCE1_004376 [Barthelona sp. PCE]